MSQAKAETASEDSGITTHCCLLWQVERIFAHKADPAKQDQRLLVKWRGLPYAESTFESLQDVLKIGGQQDIIDYQVCLTPPVFDCLYTEKYTTSEVCQRALDSFVGGNMAVCAIDHMPNCCRSGSGV